MSIPPRPPVGVPNVRPRTVLVDESFGVTGQGYRLVQVHRVKGFTVRIDIERDSYSMQSHAHAHVLTPDLVWTLVCEHPAQHWHAGTPYKTDDAAAVLDDVAADLLLRAAVILPNPTRR